MPDHEPLRRQASFRFYEELNDFLSTAQRKRTFTYTFTGTPAVKDAIEALGVPHTEVDLILIDGASVGFDARLYGGERVAVYPVFERFDIAPLSRLRSRPLRQMHRATSETKFILDVHLGKLARYLRLLGFDTRYRNDYDDAEIIALARQERRIILTRDKGILRHGAVTHGYWLRTTEPRAQLREVVRALQLEDALRPFTRCLVCNALLERVEKHEVQDRLPPAVREGHEVFWRCSGCTKVYWRGSHYERMQATIAELKGR